MGIVAVLLAIPALTLRGRSQVFALVLGLFALMVSFGSNFPLYAVLYDHLPFFNRFRIPVMVIVLFQLALALGLAWGWSTLVDSGARQERGRGRAPAEWLLIAGGAAVLLAGLVFGAGGEAVRAGYVAFVIAHKPAISPALANAAFDAFRGEVGRTVFLGLAAAALGWLALRGKLAPALSSTLAVLLLLFSLWPVSAEVMAPTIGDPVRRDLDAGKDDVVEFLQAQGGWGSFRVWDSEVSNRLAGFGIGTLHGNHAAQLRLFQDLREAGVFNAPRWLDLLNVRYIILPQPVDPQQMPGWLRQAFAGKSYVYENLGMLPRVTVVGAFGVLPDTGRATIDSVAAGTHDPRGFTWLTKPPGLTLGPVAGATASVRRYGLHDVDIDVNTPGAAIVRLADQWYPDWKATVDGRPAEILRADYALRAVIVPAGRHTLAFHFVSASFARGLALSLVSAVLALALIAMGAWRGRRSAPTSGTAEISAG
jgi:hypothetical protein